MRYIIYYRVSTDQQAKSGLGIEAQQQRCREYVTSKGSDIYLEFTDLGVSSGLRLEDREQLNAALDSLEPGDIFLVSSRDRFGRDVIQNAMTERIIEKKGAKLVTVNQDDSNLDEGMSRLMKTMIDAFAQYERYLIGRRTKAALDQKKERGERVGHIPYGYKRDGNINLVVDQYESDCLKLMHTFRCQGRTFREIADHLNSLGWRNRPDINYPERIWTHGAVCRVYKNYVTVVDGVLSLSGRKSRLCI